MRDEVGTIEDIVKLEAHNFMVDFAALNRDVTYGVGKRKVEG